MAARSCALLLNREGTLRPARTCVNGPQRGRAGLGHALPDLVMVVPGGLLGHASGLHSALEGWPGLSTLAGIQKVEFCFASVFLNALRLLVALHQQPVVRHNVIDHD